MKYALIQFFPDWALIGFFDTIEEAEVQRDNTGLSKDYYLIVQSW